MVGRPRKYARKNNGSISSAVNVNPNTSSHTSSSSSSSIVSNNSSSSNNSNINHNNSNNNSNVSSIASNSSSNTGTTINSSCATSKLKYKKGLNEGNTGQRQSHVTPVKPMSHQQRCFAQLHHCFLLRNLEKVRLGMDSGLRPKNLMLHGKYSSLPMLVMEVLVSTNLCAAVIDIKLWKFIKKLTVSCY